MDTTRLAESLREDLNRAAAVGDESVRQAATQLAFALEPSLRLALMEALTEAAAELTQGLPDGIAVEVRLQGRDPSLVLIGDLAPSSPAESAAGEGDEGEPTARITLRIPETLKQRAEHQAVGRGQSLNTWLVQAARSAVRHDRSERPDRPRRPDRHIRGWVK